MTDLMADAYRTAKRKLELQIDRLLALLGGAGKKAFKPEDLFESIPQEEGAGELSPGAVQKLVTREYDRKMKQVSKLNDAFYEAVVPHLIDHENYDKGTFGKLLVAALLKHFGKPGVTMYLDDLASFIIKHVDIFVRQIHGRGWEARPPEKPEEGESGKKKRQPRKEKGPSVSKDPIGTMILKDKDPNRPLLQEGLKFIGKVVNEDPSVPYHYVIKLQGRDLNAEEIYPLDVSTSVLDLDVGHRYKMEVTSLETGGKRVKVRIEGAGREETHLMILAAQVPKLLQTAITSFVQTEYKKKIEDKEGVLRRLEGEVRKLDDQIDEKDKAGDEQGVEELEKERDKALARIEYMTKQGLPEGERFIKEERQESPFHGKMLKHAPYTGWFDYKSEMIEGVPVDYASEGLAKVEDDLEKSLTKMHGDYKGIPYSDLSKMMWDAIYEVPDPTQRSGWQQKFVGKVQDYIKKKGLDVRFESDDPARMIEKVKETLLRDSKFKNLQQNLQRARMRGVVKAAEESKETLTKTLDDMWSSPIKPTELSLDYGALEELRKNKDIPSVLWREVVETGTVDRFRNYLEHGTLPFAFDILKAIGDAVGMYDEMVNRLKKVYLTEVWQMDDSRVSEEIKLFNEYLKAFPGNLDMRLKVERDRVYNDIKDLLSKDVKYEPSEGGKPSTKRKRRTQDVGEAISDSPVETLLKQRDPELLSEFENIVF